MGHSARSIARELDDEAAAALLTEIYEHELPSVLDDIVTDYQNLQDARPPFMWKWVHKLAPYNTLPSVQPRFTDDVPVDKTLLILFITLLDDVLEKQQDRATFHAAATAPFPRQTPAQDTSKYDPEYVEFTHRVWEVIESRLSRAPEYDTYLDLLRYDLKQAIYGIEYSDLVIQHPELATLHDLEQYESHNMVMYGYADIDLMHSRPGVRSDFHILREAIWHAQQMARIGNWVSTWRLELADGDYSSGVIVYALENGIIDHEDLHASPSYPDSSIESLIDAIETAEVEDVFLDRWDHHLDTLRDYNTEFETIDLTSYIEGLKEVLRYHLASEGLK